MHDPLRCQLADDDVRHPAQEIHDAACGFADRHGLDLCTADPAQTALGSDLLRLHAAYHRLATELGAECWGYAAREDDGERDDLERYARAGEKRSPHGGVTIGGKFYPAGEWIPAAAVGRADEDALRKINRRRRSKAPKSAPLEPAEAASAVPSSKVTPVPATALAPTPPPPASNRPPPGYVYDFEDMTPEEQARHAADHAARTQAKIDAKNKAKPARVAPAPAGSSQPAAQVAPVASSNRPPPGYVYDFEDMTPEEQARHAADHAARAKAKANANARTKSNTNAKAKTTPSPVTATSPPPGSSPSTSQTVPKASPKASAPVPPADPVAAKAARRAVVDRHVAALYKAQFHGADAKTARPSLDALHGLPDALLARVARKFLGRDAQGPRSAVLAQVAGQIAQFHAARDFEAERKATQIRRRARAAARIARDAPPGASTPGPGVDYYAERDRTLERYAAAHAPEDGVTIGGTFYDGGRFIPMGEVAKADPATRNAIRGGPNKVGNHHLDAMLARAGAGNYDFGPGVAAAHPKGGHQELTADVARFLAAHHRDDRQWAEMPKLLRSAGIAVPDEAGRAAVRDALVGHLTALTARSKSLTAAEFAALAEETADEGIPGRIENAWSRAEDGKLHPDDIGPIVDEALATADGRHDLEQYDADLRIKPGMDPERIRWRAVLALSKLNKENGGRAAPEVRREARERRLAQRERADTYRRDEPEAVARAAAGVPGTRAEAMDAGMRYHFEPGMRRRFARSVQYDSLKPTDPRHPDPEAAVLRHQIRSFRDARRATRT